MATLTPYLNFRGRAREALEFYHSVFGGHLDITTFADFSMPGIGPDQADLVMHGQLRSPNDLVLMCSDVPAGMPLADESNITIALFGDEEVELRGYWEALGAGATVSMPLEAAPWGDTYGQLTDRFGVAWMVNISGGVADGPAAG